ncbi:MAG: prolyl oligopeptidase family serine peptidase [Phycisphaerales bacterium]|jgi:predicted esterase
MSRLLAVLAILASAAAALSKPDPDVATLAPSWPARAFEQELGAKGIVIPLGGDPRRYQSFQVGFFMDRPIVPGAREHAAALLERVGDAARGVSASDVEPEQRNALVFEISPAQAAAQPEGGVHTIAFVSLRPDSFGLERTWMACEPATTEEVRGIAVIIPGTFGYPPELYEKWSQDLRSRGWSVLRLLSQPSRFTEQIMINVAAGDGAAEGRAFAAHADDRTAECAFAIEAGVAHMIARDGRLEGTPRAILGFSGGAILLPAVVARNPGAYETAVLVAGGANAASISIDSTFMKQFIRSVFFDFEDAADRADFEHAYLRHASLDGYHAAAQFDGDTRVLVVDGSFDKAVPFASSTLMIERFEDSGITPVRRTYPTNHVMLFMSLSEMIGQVNEWVDGGELGLPPGEEAKDSP